MAKIFVIVESPGKIKKIENILKKLYPQNDFIVSASVGHIIDLDKKNLSIDIENNFNPTYVPMDSKKKLVIKNLKTQYKSCDDILLATDEDREGEMIAWSISECLNLNNPKRIIFNSITENELKNAVDNPTKINENMVNAQKTRRILDRLLGYKISPILWKSANQSLSAGRVQSIVVKLIIDKENEITNFLENKIKSFYRIKSDLEYKLEIINCNLVDKNQTTKKILIDNYEETLKIMNLLVKSKYKVIDISKKDKTRNPSPPFTTSTLQQEASRKLGYSVKKTMSCAQKLYEQGYITYMRTDSINLSKEAIGKISKFVNKEYGKKYLKIRNFKSKSKNTQEAHEAIRPSNIDTRGVKIVGKITNAESRLYNLIWKRSVASQMSAAIFNNTTILIESDKLKKKKIDYLFSSEMDELVFDGFLAVYNYKENEDDDDKDEDNIIKKLPKINDKLTLDKLYGNNEYNNPPPRYNEASLVNKLDPKNLNIGRPSTYATIIDKIQDKKYVIKEDKEGISKNIKNIIWESKNCEFKIQEKEIFLCKEKNKLVPTEMGKLITKFLIDNFPDIMEYEFTSNIEDELDKIAEGNKIWFNVLSDFYKKFEPLLDIAKNKNINILDENQKELGIHPTTNNPIYVTVSKYGAVVKMKDGKSSKFIYAPIKKPLTLKNIKFEDALKLLEYPKNLGKIGNSNVILCKGQYGLYIKMGTNTYSLAKEDINEADINIDYVKEIVKKENEKFLWNDEDEYSKFNILKGPYGLYVNIKSKKGKQKPKNVSLSDDLDLKKLKLDELKEIIKKKSITFNKYKKK